MKRFRFRLEVLLGVRHRHREAAQLALAAASRRLQEAAEGVAAVREQQKAAQRWLEEQQRTGQLSAGLLPLHAGYLQALARQEAELMARQEGLRQERQERLAQLEEAVTKLKAVETLKEQQRQQHWQAQLQEEQQLLDEIGMQLYLRAEEER